MGLGRSMVVGRRLDLAVEAVSAEADQWLARRLSERESLGHTAAGQNHVSLCPVISCPGQPTIGLTKDTLAPAQPPAVRFQPHPGVSEILGVEAEIGREALEEEPFLADEVSRLSGRSVGEEGADLRPGDLWFPTVAGENRS